MAAMALMQRSTLILTTSIKAVRQWQRELLDKTDLTEDQIAEYTGNEKTLAPSPWPLIKYSRTGRQEG